MTGFETYNAAGKLTFSTRDSTYLVVGTKLIPGTTNSNGKTHQVSIALPEGFTSAKVTMYPTTALHPSTGAIMPNLRYAVVPHGSSLKVNVTAVQVKDRAYPPCLLTVLGN